MKSRPAFKVSSERPSNSHVPRQLTFASTFIDKPSFKLHRGSLDNHTLDPELNERPFTRADANLSIKKRWLVSSPKVSPQSVPHGSPLRNAPSHFRLARRSVDIEKGQQNKKPFNYNKYEVVEGDKIIVKAEERMAQWREQKDGIREALALLIHQQVLSQVDERIKLDALFQSNKVIWAKVLLRTKPFQSLLAEMITRAKIILEREFTHNSEQLNAFLTHPRPSPPRLKLVPPAPRPLLPHEVYRSAGKDSTSGNEKGRNSVSKEEVEKEPPQEVKLMRRKLGDIDELVDNLEEGENALGDKVGVFQSHTRAKVGIDYFENIGRQIRQKLQEMANSSAKISTGEEIEQRVRRGWKEYESFEKQLAKQKEEHEMQLRQTKHAFLSQIDWIKRKTAFRIKALETALTEVKLKYRTLYDRSLMEKEDQLAQDYNDEWNKGNPAEAIFSIEMAKRKIMRLNKQIKAQTRQINKLEGQTKENDKKITDLELDLQELKQQSQTKEQSFVKQKNVLREGLKKVLNQVQLYQNTAKQSHLIMMLEKDDSERERAALNYLEQNEGDELLKHVRRDCQVMKTKFQELRDKMKRLKMLGEGKRDKNITLNSQARGYFQNYFKDQNLRQILALKEGQMAVGLQLDIPEYQEQETEEESEEDTASLKRNTSRLNATVNIRSRKVSGISHLSSSIKSPGSPRQTQIQSRSPEPRLTRSKTSIRSNLTTKPKEQQSKSAVRLPREKISLKAEFKKQPTEEIKEDSFRESYQSASPQKAEQIVKIHLESTSNKEHSVEEVVKEEEHIAEVVIEKEIEQIESQPKKSERKNEKQNLASIREELLKQIQETEKRKETEIEKIAKQLVRSEERLKLEEYFERFVTMPNRKQRKLSTFVLNYLNCLVEALKQSDQTKVNRLLNMRSGVLEQQPKPIRTVSRVSPVQKINIEQSSRCPPSQSNIYKRRESPRLQAKANYVRGLREKQREEKGQDEDQIKKLEDWVRLETKKTITALEKYIRVSASEDSGPTRQDLERLPILSDQVDVLSSSTSPLSQIYSKSQFKLVGRSMRGKALRALPRKKLLESARKINLPGRRSSLVERSLPDTSETDWKPLAGVGMIHSPHMLSYEKQQSQDFLTLSSQASVHPLVYLNEGSSEQAKLFPKSTFHQARQSIKDKLNLSLTLPQWRGAADGGQSSREKSSSVEDRSARYH